MISVVGTSGSGKTASIEYLTRHLTRLGFTVGVAKHIHKEGFTIDTVDKDTWKHARAGAMFVIGVSPNELATIKKTSEEARFSEISEILRSQDLDIALLEGFSTAILARSNIYKIVAAKNTHDLDYTLSKTSAPILAITGRIATGHKLIRNAPAPLVDIEREGPLLTSMIRRFLRPRELVNMFRKATARHGERCVELAIGVRAAHVGFSAFGHHSSGSPVISCGTSQCIAEAFRTVYPRSRLHISKIRNGRITLKLGDTKVFIQLASNFQTKGFSIP